ncbi:MAG: YhbY family RNA-binding protein [Candidatus Pacearchaeota archaeon]|nr:YhbY family RNA-binding protein [Nanoarchaeota archaeon]MDZ4226628.1 YhbY family RNA-binding protein [Candidatus Pacearchaeota archaeon]
MTHSHIQLGKNGITENFVESMKSHFKKHDNVKISVLKSAGHSKDAVRKYSENILEKLGRNYTAKTVGFTISLKKWRKNVR